jgi:hypothetical protein
MAKKMNTYIIDGHSRQVNNSSRILRKSGGLLYENVVREPFYKKCCRTVNYDAALLAIGWQRVHLHVYTVADRRSLRLPPKIFNWLSGPPTKGGPLNQIVESL